jgi:hypothetical protein
VLAGSYKENPTANKAVNLIAPNAGIAGTARGSESTVISNGNQNAVFSITSSNVKIDGFTADGDDPLSATALTSGDDTQRQLRHPSQRNQNNLRSRTTS